jgi:ATP-dependent DNA helicase RecG
MDPNTQVQYLKGVGPRKASLLKRLEVQTVRDLLWHLPRAWLDRSRLTPLPQLVPGAQQTAVAMVRSARLRRARGGMTIFEADLEGDGGHASAAWFNQPFLADRIRPGQFLLLSGQVRVDQDARQFTHPEYEILADGGTDDALSGGRIVPVYPLTAGLTQRMLRVLVRAALDEAAVHLRDPLPPALRERLCLPDLSWALERVHFPVAPEDADKARDRLAFDEFAALQLAFGLARRRRDRAEAAIPLCPAGLLQQQLRTALPFALTDGQEHVLSEILADMARPGPMNRLLQGDVGSGKTVVAALAILAAAEVGVQSAYLAPTEILAAQQAQLFEQWFGPLGVKSALLLGRTPAAERRRLHAALAAGEIAVLVGTHAILGVGVEFSRLGFVVVDEQHRFGVLQRQRLRDKGEHGAVVGERAAAAGEVSPHCLVMSATPIPRTLSLTLYGDLDVSLLREMPAGRVSPITRLVDDRRRAPMLRWIADRLREGERAFFVHPLVEESELVDLRDATSAVEELKQHPSFAGIEIGLLHGRMKGPEKDLVVQRFRDGKVPCLVTTTVVEVGVDIPRATIMVIEHPDRFGLSQLHQLRGRIGRGGGASHLFLMASAKGPAHARLQVLVRHADGFQVAEEDLRLRGPGEFLGTAQSGLPRFRVADLVRDRDLPVRARAEAERILAEDPDLTAPEHAELRALVQYLYGARMRLYEVG